MHQTRSLAAYFRAVDLSIEQARPRRHGDPAAAHYREQLLTALGVSTEPTQYEDDAR